MPLKPRDCFDICWDAYRNARTEIDERAGIRALDASDLRDENWRPRVRPLLADFCVDFQRAGERALSGPHSASRLILFRVFYLGLAPYERARPLVGIGELTWARWTEEIRDRVGRELRRAGIFPPGRYFREPSIETSTGGIGCTE
jgi:hypothetical protein